MTNTCFRPLLFTLLSLSFCLYAEEEKKEEIHHEIHEVKELSRTSHSIVLDTTPIKYEAICGMMPLEQGDEADKAIMYFTYYMQNQEESDKSDRPLMFCFNGGPGSSSVWLHMGLLGPKMVKVKDAAFTAPPGSYIDNTCTILDKADIVFIDPVSTGFSKPLPGSDPKQFHSIEGDAESFAEFIRMFLTHFKRWQSPKYLMGESYGTIRAVALANYLHDAIFIDINGIVLLSMCLDFQAYDFGNGNDLAYIVTLPTYAACAHYHKKVAPEHQEKSLQEFLTEVEHFALHEYATALLLGDMMGADAKEKLAERIAGYTGLRKDYIVGAHFRIFNNNFYHELLKKELKIIGRFDGRYTGYDTTSFDEPHLVGDPSFDAITGPFTSAFQQYLSQELKITKTDPYHILNPNAVFPWNFSIDRQPAGAGYVYMSGTLRGLIEKNPSLQVLVLSGIYDLATPYFAADYSLSHLKLNSTLRKNIQVRTFEGGHMMYLNPEAHKQIRQDLLQFLR
jgi:carboxypeptidase C (cathepsin A)